MFTYGEKWRRGFVGSATDNHQTRLSYSENITDKLQYLQLHNAKPDIVNYSRLHLFIHLFHNKSYKMALRNH